MSYRFVSRQLRQYSLNKVSLLDYASLNYRSRYYKSVNSFKARTKKRIIANMKKAKDNNSKPNANEGLTLEEIKQRDLEKIQEKQKAWEEKQKIEANSKKKK